VPDTPANATSLALGAEPNCGDIRPHEEHVWHEACIREGETTPRAVTCPGQPARATSPATQPLGDRAYWEGLSARELDRSIRDARNLVAERETLLFDAQGFLDNLLTIRATKRRSA